MDNREHWAVTYNGNITNKYNSAATKHTRKHRWWNRNRTMPSKLTFNNAPDKPPFLVPVPGTPCNMVSYDNLIHHRIHPSIGLPRYCEGWVGLGLYITFLGRLAHRAAIKVLRRAMAQPNTPMVAVKTHIPPTIVKEIAVNDAIVRFYHVAVPCSLILVGFLSPLKKNNMLRLRSMSPPFCGRNFGKTRTRDQRW